MKTFREFIVEYERTSAITKESPISHFNVDDIDHDEFHTPKKLGVKDGHTILHYKHKEGGSHFTFAVDGDGATSAHIEHKTPTVKGRLAISNITNVGGSRGLGGKMVHSLIHTGHTIESDNTNSEGAHKMLMGLAKHPDVKTHIEDGKGKVIPHKGDVTSLENQKKYVVTSKDPNFLEDKIHKHVLVMRRIP